MKYLFVIVFGAGIFLTVCNAACFLQKPLNGCLYGGDLHAFSSAWVTKECLTCYCYADGSVGCCTLSIPSSVIGRDDCEVLEDKATCTARFVYKKNHTKDCV